jgi:hypothetical protein
MKWKMRLIPIWVRHLFFTLLPLSDDDDTPMEHVTHS